MKKGNGSSGCGTFIGIIIIFSLAVMFLKAFWWLFIGGAAVLAGIAVYQKKKASSDQNRIIDGKMEFSQTCPFCGAKSGIKPGDSVVQCKNCGETFPIDKVIVNQSEKERVQGDESQKKVNLIPISIFLAILGVIGLFLNITGFGEKSNTNQEKSGPILQESTQNITEMESTQNITDIDSTQNITEMAFADTSEVTVKTGQDSTVGTLNVTVVNSWDFSKEDVVFVSEDPGTATITREESSYGNKVNYKIHGIKSGTTNVYARSADGKVSSGIIHVVVLEPINVEAVSFDFEEITLSIGESREVTANITPDNAENKEIKWSSGDSSVATVDQEGMIAAVGGGTTVITAEASNGVSSSFNLIVDASKRLMSLRISHPRDDDVNIGDEWSYQNEINGENPKNEYAIAVGDTLSFYSKYTESDENPDVGEASQTHVVTEENLANGFAVTMDVYVTENGGRNSGKSAHFVVTYTFSVK